MGVPAVLRCCSGVAAGERGVNGGRHPHSVVVVAPAGPETSNNVIACHVPHYCDRVATWTCTNTAFGVQDGGVRLMSRRWIGLVGSVVRKSWGFFFVSQP